MVATVAQWSWRLIKVEDVTDSITAAASGNFKFNNGSILNCRKNHSENQRTVPIVGYNDEYRCGR